MDIILSKQFIQSNLAINLSIVSQSNVPKRIYNKKTTQSYKILQIP